MLDVKQKKATHAHMEAIACSFTLAHARTHKQQDRKNVEAAAHKIIINP